MPDLKLILPGSSLAAAMEDAPTVVMAAVGGAPPSAFWEAVTYRLRYGAGQAYASAHVMRLEGHPDAPEGREWIAMCSGPGESQFADSWHATAEAARAAVEEHVLTAGESR